MQVFEVELRMSECSSAEHMQESDLIKDFSLHFTVLGNLLRPIFYTSVLVAS